MRKFSIIICNWLERVRLYGLRNTFRLYKYLKKPREFALKQNGNKFYLRGKTVDFVVFHSIFGNKEYKLQLPFEPDVIVDAGANIGASTLFFKTNFPNKVMKWLRKTASSTLLTLVLSTSGCGSHGIRSRPGSLPYHWLFPYPNPSNLGEHNSTEKNGQMQMLIF